MSKTIYLLDGDGDSRDVLRLALEHHGYRVVAQHDSARGLAEIRELRPDLLIVELFLRPAAGDSVIRQVRGDPATADLPVVCLTSRVMDENRRAALKAGADLFLPKPIAPSDVLQHVQSLLGAPGGTS